MKIAKKGKNSPRGDRLNLEFALSVSACHQWIYRHEARLSFPPNESTEGVGALEMGGMLILSQMDY